MVGRCERVQAVVTRTQTPPSLGVNKVTPYEEVCGIRTSGLIGQAWTTRWLRWCAERLWIGRSLVRHLEGRAAQLEPFVVREEGDVLELYAEDVDALEHALEPLLPTVSDTPSQNEHPTR